ncbi:hypothetical protein BBP40_009526 [Aspergillus hancockii]|nr:hypothetical protein BBP40_009526 [Aspergillus hancockii]
MVPTTAGPIDIEFTIGWICSLFNEYIAAREVLDEIYDERTPAPKNSFNRYTRGRIGGHKVVIGCPSAGKYGIVSTPGVAEDMGCRFPCIRFVLVVGIASGAPRPKHDVRLGDVVIGTKVVQYGLGKRTSAVFKFVGHTSTPSQALVHAVTELKRRLVDGLDLHERLEAVFTRSPAIKATFARPEPHTDRLYKSQYVHLNGCQCLSDSEQQSSQFVQRPPREDTRVEVHDGVVGSASQAIKHAITRDHLADEIDALCFELEAAGVKGTFNWLPIRGICDYSDSHKTGDWHGYAAAAAAVCAKELLLTIPPENQGDSSVARQTEEEIPVVPGFIGYLQRARYGLSMTMYKSLIGTYLLLGHLGRVIWSLYILIVLTASHLHSPETKPSNKLHPEESSEHPVGNDATHINIHIGQKPTFTPTMESDDEWIEAQPKDQPEFSTVQWYSNSKEQTVDNTVVLLREAKALMGRGPANGIDIPTPQHNGSRSSHRDSSYGPLDTDLSRYSESPEEMSPASGMPRPPVPPRSKKPRGYVSRRNTQIPVPSSMAQTNKYSSEHSGFRANQSGETPDDILNLIWEVRGRASV